MVCRIHKFLSPYVAIKIYVVFVILKIRVYSMKLLQYKSCIVVAL